MVQPLFGELAKWSETPPPWLQIDLFHNNFSPSGTQPEQRKLAKEL